jgi:putative oxidoreductase
MSNSIVFLIGRILFSLIFIIKAFSHFTPQAIQHAEYMGVPAATVLVPLAGLIALVGGLSVILGYRGRIGAWILVAFLVVTAFGMHRFWQEPNGYRMLMNHFCFWKNISMIGAALMITYFGTGPYSLDDRFNHKTKRRK